jgi:hypothetical protein
MSEHTFRGNIRNRALRRIGRADSPQCEGCFRSVIAGFGATPTRLHFAALRAADRCVQGWVGVA